MQINRVQSYDISLKVWGLSYPCWDADVPICLLCTHTWCYLAVFKVNKEDCPRAVELERCSRSLFLDNTCSRYTFLEPNFRFAQQYPSGIPTEMLMAVRCHVAWMLQCLLLLLLYLSLCLCLYSLSLYLSLFLSFSLCLLLLLSATFMRLSYSCCRGVRTTKAMATPPWRTCPEKRSPITKTRRSLTSLNSTFWLHVPFCSHGFVAHPLQWHVPVTFKDSGDCAMPRSSISARFHTR